MTDDVKRNLFLVIAEHGEYSDYRVLHGPIFNAKCDALDLIKELEKFQHTYSRACSFTIGWLTARGLRGKSGELSTDQKNALETELNKNFYSPVFISSITRALQGSDLQIDISFPMINEYWFEPFDFSVVELPYFPKKYYLA